MYIGFKEDRKGLSKLCGDTEIDKFGEDFETKAWTTKHFHNTAEANKQFIVDKSTGGFRQDILLSFIAMHIFSLNSKVDIFRKQIRFLNFLLFVIVVLILLKVLQLI